MKYLFIGSHTDDIELCCGGTVAKYIEEGHDVICETLSHVYYGRDLTKEWNASMSSLAIPNYEFKNFTPRYFHYERQDILQWLVELREQHQPDIIFTHSAHDQHQDHSVVGYESVRAFKNLNLITYCGEWNQFVSEANFYVQLSDEQMQKKLKALECYASQQSKHYFDRDFNLSRALLSGAKIGAKYAESFRILNMIG